MCLWAHADRVFDHDNKTTNGRVEQISKKGVRIKKSGKLIPIPISKILKIQFDDDPKALTDGRDFTIKEQYDQALTELRKIDLKSIQEPGIRADAMFYIALCQSKLALAGKSSPKTATSSMLKFVGANRDSWHFYDAAKTLGDLAVTLGDLGKAKQYYGSLAKAPTAQQKIQSVYLIGTVALKAKDYDQAIVQFDKLLKQKFDSTLAVRTQMLARAGKAVALTRKGDADGGMKLIVSLIQQLNPTDIEMAARIYNAEGAIHEAKQDIDGAIISYLHTHLHYSSQPDAHAEALKRLAELFPKVGKPDRAAEFRQELQERYPGML